MSKHTPTHRRTIRKPVLIGVIVVGICAVIAASIVLKIATTYPKMDAEVSTIEFTTNTEQLRGGMKGQDCGEATINGTRYCMDSPEKVTAYITSHKITGMEHSGTRFMVVARVRLGENKYQNNSIETSPITVMPTIFIQSVESVSVIK